MKYIKLFLFIFLIMFCFNIDAKAQSLNCKYSYNYNKNISLTLEIEISYNGGNEVYITKKIPTYQNVTTGVTGLSDTIPSSYVYNSEKKLSCPVLYAKTNLESSGRNVVYGLDFSINKKIEGYTKIETNDFTIDDTKNEEPEEGENNKIKYTCVYKSIKTDEEMFYFQIKENKRPINLTGMGSNIGSAYFWNDDEVKNREFEKCPSFIKVNVSGYGITRVSPSNDKSNSNYYYAGEGTTTDGVEKNFVAIYVDYYSDKKIKILKDEITNEFYTISNQNSKVENFNEYKNAFNTGNSENYPKYIVEYVDSNGLYTHKFSEYSDSKANVNYINLNHVGELYKASGNINETCRDLLGDNFLKFLNNNVFKVIYIGVPILLIVLTTFDFAKVVFIDDKDGIGIAGKKFGKRVIAAFLIYLVPTILIFVSNIFGSDEINKCAKTIKELVETYES